MLNGRRKHKLEETIAGFEVAKSLVHSGDISDEKYVERLVADAVAKFGKLDVLVNNAAFGIFGPFEKTTTADWRKVMAAFRERLPIGRAATPEEVAGVIAFLASEDTLFVNGVILSVDGGLHASNGQPNFLALLGAK